ncbi:transposase [Halpernia sp.]|uniref:transposase n=1 Tax=Halpernia sp. TaxID=2782209 RepID=UPI003A91831F
MNVRLDQLEEGYFYHLYNRGINGCPVFLNDDNRFFFLEKVEKYLLPIADLYAYCLMPNHFHLIIRIKDNLTSETPLMETLPKFGTLAKLETGLHSDKSLASKQIAKLISSYTQAFNKYHNRHGSLFERPFKRKRIESEDYLTKAIVYVHRNVIDLDYEMEGYEFCSYKNIVSTAPSPVRRKEIMDLFDGIENFIDVHKRENDYEM